MTSLQKLSEKYVWLPIVLIVLIFIWAGHQDKVNAASDKAAADIAEYQVQQFVYFAGYNACECSHIKKEHPDQFKKVEKQCAKYKSFKIWKNTPIEEKMQ